MSDTITDTLKKVLITGVGAANVTIEKSKIIIDKLVERGEITIDQGKVLNEELMHNVKEKAKNNAFDSVIHNFDQLSNKQRAILAEKLAVTPSASSHPNTVHPDMFEESDTN